MSLLGGLLTGGLSLGFKALGNKISNNQKLKTDMKLAQQQFNYQNRLMDKQNQFNVDMWNMNNEYNTPAAQASRLSDAGFNPAMSMGNVVSSQPLTSANPSFGMPNSSRSTALDDMAQTLMQALNVEADLRVKDAQAKNIDADTEKKKSEVPLNESQTRLNDANTAFTKVRENWESSSFDERLKNLQASTESLVNNAVLSESKSKEINEVLPYISRLKEAELKSLDAATKKALEEAVTEVSKRHNLEASAKASLASAYLSYQMGDTQAYQRMLLSSQVQVNNINAEKINQEIGGIIIDNFSKEFSANFYRDKGFPPGWTTQKQFVETALLLNPEIGANLSFDLGIVKGGINTKVNPIGSLIGYGNNLDSFTGNIFGRGASVPSSNRPSVMPIIEEMFVGKSKPRKNPFFNKR